MNHADSLLKRLKETADDDAAVELLNAFHAGVPIQRLRELLASSSPSGIRAGVWIASELGKKVRPLLAEIERLVAHPDRYVRFFVLDCVLSAAGKGDGQLLASAAALINDVDSGVRWKAMNFLASASREQLSEAARVARDEKLHDQLSWLEDAEMLGSAVIRAKLTSHDPQERMLSAIAAARIADIDATVLYAAAEIDQADVKDFAVDRLARHAK